MAEYKGVMVYGEVADGKLAAITTELLGCGRKLADDLGQELCAVLVGSGISSLAQEAIAFGADKVYVIDDPLLKDYQTDSNVPVMEKLVKELDEQSKHVSRRALRLQNALGLLDLMEMLGVRQEEIKETLHQLATRARGQERK